MKIDGINLRIDEVEDVSRNFEPVELSVDTFDNIDRSVKFIEDILKEGRVVYGINTGFGKLCEKVITLEDASILQKNLLLSHASGTGPPLSQEEVRAAILVRANSLVRGFSAVRREIIQKLIDILNLKIYPYVPSYGSLGASGDLAPLAHIALILLGRGRVIKNKEILDALPILLEAGFKPVENLMPKEGLALINGTAVESGIAAILVQDANYLFDVSLKAATLSMEALRAKREPFDKRIHKLRNSKEQEEVAERILMEVEGSKLMDSAFKVQDAYSIRCIPQVYGAVLKNMRCVEETISQEINAVTDNPLIFEGDGDVLTGGNFHAEPIAFAMDILGMVFTDMGNMVERRINRLLNPALSGLPPFLTERAGIQSGLMILQYIVASLLSENKILSHPASCDSISVSADQEDHVSMGMNAVIKAKKILDNFRKITSCELIVAAQGADFCDSKLLGQRTGETYRRIREVVPFAYEDREFSYDIDKIEGILQKKEL